MRVILAPVLSTAASRLDRAPISPVAITATGLLAGVGCCLAAGLGAWTVALVLWLANRTLDGLDGALARRRGATTDLGGMLDLLADFVVYAGFPLGVAIAVPDARIAACALLGTYLLNNVALLSFSSLIERRGLKLGDERSLRFTTGLTEGTETITCYAIVCLLPEHAATIFWVFGAMVMITVGQRVALATRTL